MSRTLRRCAIGALLVLSSAVSERAATTTLPMQSPSAAIISGVVVSMDRVPVQRARVVLTSAGEMRAVQSTTTDDAGHFSFGGVTPGRYRLAASKAAWLTGTYGATLPGRPGASFVVGNGDSLTDVTLRTCPGGVITGTVTTPTGEPAPPVEVKVMRYVTSGTGQRTLEPRGETASLVSDDLGHYRVYGLAPGEYVVVAVPPASPAGQRALPRQLSSTDLQAALMSVSERGMTAPVPAVLNRPPDSGGSAMSYSPMFYPGTPDLAAAKTVLVALNAEITDVNFQIRRIPAVTVSGVVSSTVPFDPASVRLTLMPAQAAFASATPQLAKPDVEGRFLFSGVTAGSYVLLASAAPVSNLPGRSALPSTLYGAADISIVGANLIQPIDLRPGRTVSGTVNLAGSAEAVNADRRVLLQLVSQADRPALGVPTVTVDPFGGFQFVGVPPGEYRLLPTVPILQGKWFFDSIVAGGIDVTEGVLDLDADVRDVVVTFTDRPSELSGTLQDASGRPVGDYFVVVFPQDRSRWQSLRRIAKIRTDSKGAFLVKGLPAGVYYIAVATDLNSDDELSGTTLEQMMPSVMPITLEIGKTTMQNLRLSSGGK